jgi:Uma2 family endonuclease
VTIAEKIKLGPADAGAPISRAEFAEAACEAPFVYERVQGRLVVMSPAGPEHRFVSRPFRRELGGYWASHPELIDDVDVEGWVATGAGDDRIPDICVYLASSAGDEQVPHRVPDLIFEFVSTSRSDQERDYIDKRAEYHRIGVQEYVIADRLKRAVLVLTWAVEDYDERWLGPAAVYETALLPGLRVPLAELFADYESR